MRTIARFVALACILALVACGPSYQGDDDDDDDDDAGSNPTCTTGANVCIGDVVHTCPDGRPGPSVETCGSGLCQNGACQTRDVACADAIASRSYIGCEYWPVDLDNAVETDGTELFPGFGCLTQDGSGVTDPVNMPVCGTDGIAGLCDYGMSCTDSPGTSCAVLPMCSLNAQQSPFAIVVSNPQSAPVTVTLKNGRGQMAMDTVAPGQVKALFPAQLGFTDQSLDFTGIENKAFQLTSSAPIVAYQFNPLDNVGVFSNDASLLIPAHAFDTEYTGISFKTLTRRPGKNDYNGYVTVVASAPGTTTVTVTPKAGVRVGTGVAAIAAGATQTFTLDQFQTLNLEAVAGGDLTGTPITCSAACAVFGGHEATVLSNQAQSPCCADHLEDQIFPNSTWGKVYVVAHSKTRGMPVPDLIRVVAQSPGTTVTFNPAQAGCTGTLAAGQFCDVFTSADVEVSSNQPIFVAHYLLSNGGTGSDGADPSMAFAVATEQYRSSYTLLIPSQYDQNFLSIAAPAGSTVSLDGNDVTDQLAAFGPGTFKAGRVPVTAGPHTLTCPGTCGVEVYGWSEAVSYLFAGGLDLEQIVIGRTNVGQHHLGGSAGAAVRR